jgi:parallel beta-helix repeat protein
MCIPESVFAFINNTSNLCLCFLLLCNMAYSKTIFVDQKIKGTQCDHYSIESRDCCGIKYICFKDIQSAINTAGYGDTIMIREGFYPEAILLDLHDTMSGYLIITSYRQEQVVIDGNNPAIGPLVSIQCDSVIISGLQISHSNTFGIYSRNTSGIIIDNCEVSYSNDGGIVFVDAASIQVSRCHVHHNNYRGLSAAHEAISMHNVNTFDICGCEVHDNREEGIDAKYGSKLGRIHHNTVYRNNGPNIYVDTANQIDIYNNVVHSAVAKSGISLNIESAWHTPGLAWTLKYVKLYNNIIYNNSGGIGFWLEPGNGEEKQALWDHICIINNTIVDNSRMGIDRGGGIYILNPEPENFGNHLIIRNNIFCGNINENAKSIWDRYSKGQLKKFTIDHNMFINGESSDEFGDSAVIVDDPGFSDPVNADFSIKDGSPAIDRGSKSDIPEIDYTGRARCIGNAPDIGAFEYYRGLLGTGP